MTDKKTLSEILQEYGLAVYGSYQDFLDNSNPLSLFEDAEDIKQFRNALLECEDEPKEVCADLESPELWLKDYIFYSKWCRITDLNQWKRAFGFLTEDFPFPDEYLTCFNPYRYSSWNLGEFSTPFIDIEDIANLLSKSKEEVRSELVPSYSLHKLFQKEEAVMQADDEIIRKINDIDDFFNNEKTVEMCDKLFHRSLEIAEFDVERYNKEGFSNA